MIDKPMAPSDAPPRIRQSLTGRFGLPMVSGKASAAAMLACLALTALLIPMALRLDPWLDAEIVLAGWWVIWTVGLAYLLFTGQRVSDDHQLASPRNWLGSTSTDPKTGKVKSRSSGSSWWSWGPGWSIPGDEGCVMALGVVLALIALFFAAWFLIEVAIPLVAFVMYLVLRGMLAKAANDRHSCQGNLFLAVVWGSLWATLYTSPLAGAVWAIHVLAKRMHGA